VSREGPAASAGQRILSQSRQVRKWKDKIRDHKPHGDAGFSVRDAVRGYFAVYSYTVGFTIEEQAVYPRPGERNEQYDLAKRAERIDSHAAAVILQAAIDALPDVVQRVGDRVPVLVDGGIQRGTDVLKAIALGAAAVLIGRPYCYGLGLAGSEGVRRVVDILRAELEAAMMLCGAPAIADIDDTLLWEGRAGSATAQRGEPS